VKLFIEQFEECIKERKQTPHWKHHPHAGYYRKYILLPKSLFKYKIELPQKWETYSTVFCDFCLEPIY